MASTYSNLKIELIGTGDQSGTWGNTTNINLGTAIEEAITGSVDVTFASADVTLTLTNTNGSQAARNLRLNLTGISGGARNLIVPAIEKFYIINNGLADDVTVKNSTGSGTVIPAGTSGFVFNNATDVVAAINYFSGTFGAISTTTVTASSYVQTPVVQSASTISLKTNGTTTAMTIDASQNVGIGTVTPTQPLVVAKAQNSNTFVRITNSDTGISAGAGLTAVSNAGTLYAFQPSTAGGGTATIYTDTTTGGMNIKTFNALPLQFGTSNLERMRIDSSGNVGIGINNGGTYGKFGVGGTGYQASFVQSTDASGVIGIVAANGSSELRVGAASNHPVDLYTNNQGRMRIDTSGNVGIGTTSITYRLDVNGVIRSSTSTNGGSVVVGNNLNSTLGTFGVANGSSTVAINNNGGNFPISLQQGGVDKLFIDTSGNVGIGTTSPSVKLDVIGSIEASAAATQDGVILAGRAGGTSSFAVTLTPTTLTASRTITLPDATTTMVGTDTTQTLTNKRVNPRSLAAANTSGAITPNSDTFDQVNYLLTGSSSFSNPSGTPVNGQKLTIRLFASSSQNISSWSSTSGGYRAIGVTLPTSVPAGKTVYVGCIWNSTDSRWDVIAVATQA